MTILLSLLILTPIQDCEEPQDPWVQCQDCWAGFMAVRIPPHSCRKVTMCPPCSGSYRMRPYQIPKGHTRECGRCKTEPVWPKWADKGFGGFELCLPCAKKHDECFHCGAGVERTREQFWDDLCWGIDSAPRIEERLRREIKRYGEKPMIRLMKELGAVDLYLTIAKGRDRIKLEDRKKKINALIKKLTD